MRILITLALTFTTTLTFSQTLLRPDRVFDGKALHDNWVVLVNGNTIAFAGKEGDLKPLSYTPEIKLDGTTLMPGLIEGHSHLLLHPYNETSWNDQVLKETPVARAIRGKVHAKTPLKAGSTTLREFGTKGARNSDAYIKKTLEDGIIISLRLLFAAPPPSLIYN